MSAVSPLGMLLAPGGPKQASPPSRSRPYHRAGPIGVRLIRTADLPTCRPARSDHQGYRPSYSPPAIVEASCRPSTPMAKDSPSDAPQDTTDTTEPWCISRRIFRCHRSESSCVRHLPSPMKTARNKLTLNDQVLSQ